MASPATTSTASAPATAPATATAPTTAASADTENLPSALTLFQAFRLAMQQDKAIQADYYMDTLSGKAFIAEDPESKEKVLVKSRDEYTSNVGKMYKVGNEYLIMTENSIYIVSSKIQKRKFPHSMLKMDDDLE